MSITKLHVYQIIPALLIILLKVGLMATSLIQKRFDVGTESAESLECYVRTALSDMVEIFPRCIKPAFYAQLYAEGKKVMLDRSFMKSRNV